MTMPRQILFLAAAVVLAAPAVAQKPGHRTYTARFQVSVDARRLPADVQAVSIGCELRFEGRLVSSASAMVPVTRGSTRGANVHLSLEVPDPSFERLLLAKGAKYACAVKGVKTAAGEMPLAAFPNDPKRATEVSGVIPASAWPYPEPMAVALALRPPPSGKSAKGD